MSVHSKNNQLPQTFCQGFDNRLMLAGGFLLSIMYKIYPENDELNAFIVILYLFLVNYILLTRRNDTLILRGKGGFPGVNRLCYQGN